MREVWQAFARRFRWVAGVAGNHDHFGDPRAQARFGREDRIHLLDEDAAQLDGLVVAGVGGIIGDPKRPFRRWADDFLLAIVNVLDLDPDLLVLHEGPDVPRTYPEQVGNAQVRAAIGDRPRPARRLWAPLLAGATGAATSWSPGAQRRSPGRGAVPGRSSIDGHQSARAAEAEASKVYSDSGKSVVG